MITFLTPSYLSLHKIRVGNPLAKYGVHRFGGVCKNPHVQQNPRVALNFDGNGFGGDIIVITGEAQVSPDDPPADQLPAYVQKYSDFIATRYETPENFASIYSVALRIRPISIRGH